VDGSSWRYNEDKPRPSDWAIHVVYGVGLLPYIIVKQIDHGMTAPLTLKSGASMS